MLVSTGIFADIVNLFSDLNLTTYIGVGIVIGGVAYLLGRVAKSGR